jgi:hypothetical protein
VSHNQIEQECVKLSADMDALKQEKAKIMSDHKTELAAEQKFFWAYRVSHRKKLHDLCMELERAINDIGARCLLYPKKGSTIGEVTVWYTNEIQALPNVIAKATNNFLVYSLWCSEDAAGACLIGDYYAFLQCFHFRCCA